MNAIVEIVNATGKAFVEFAMPMLIQSGLLIVILLAADLMLRKRVRAVFRYWIWMLVLVKLVMPPSMWSPVSVGHWLGDPSEAPTVAINEWAAQPAQPSAEPRSIATEVLLQSSPTLVAPVSPVMEDPDPQPLYSAAAVQTPPPAPAPAVGLPGPSLNWQGFVLLSWVAVVLALSMLLLQRSFFVRDLVAQAQDADEAMQDTLSDCRSRVGMRHGVSLKLSALAGSPAACGLFHPVILIPQTLAPRLESHDLEAVLLHELAHIKRHDLWINLAQTLLQIVYFYNPLLWLANMMIRRTREQAVDEAVLVAMGDTAQQYPETLVNIAKLAFRRRPALSLRLVGVVESKSALSARIRHMLTRPIPRTARLGALGLAAIALLATVLLPMARGGVSSRNATRDQVMIARWMVVLRDDSAMQALATAQPVASTSKSYQAVQIDANDLLSAIRNCRENDQVLHLVEDLKWVEPSGKHLHADSWSDSTNLRRSIYSQFSTGGAGPYKLAVNGTRAKLDLRYEFVSCDLNPGVHTAGSIFFKGSLRAGQALVMATPMRQGEEIVATHLVVWQVVPAAEGAVVRADAIHSASRWIEVGPALLTMPAHEVTAALREQEDGPSPGFRSLVVSRVNEAVGISNAGLDSDGDGLTDYQEVHKYLTDPAKKDSDGDGTPDGDWAERREYAYSVRTVMRYLPPVDEDGLNDDFQDGRVLKQSKDYVEVEVVHYPLATGYDVVSENRNWRRDDAGMKEFLAPGATTNWDDAMRRDLVAALKTDGIDVERLTDKDVVEQVSAWLMKRSRSLDSVFTTYYVDFPDGTPRVYPGLEEAFRSEFERDSRNYDWPIEQHMEHEVLGKGMYYNKTHGSCTSTAVYLTTVLRALGIPTRMILVTPVVDASDREQVLMVKGAITHNRVRLTMLAALGQSGHGFTNHTLNEVYVGGRWRRLDYTQLGCPAFGPHRFGLQTHLYTFNDLSDPNFAPTWGRRYAKGEHNEIFAHDNPYCAMEISESFGVHGNILNPPFTAQDVRTYPEPDIFLYSPSRANVWEAFIERVARTTANKTGRPHEKEYYDNLFDGIWLTRPQDVLVLLFSLDTQDRVPQGYEDVLPRPWSQIEASLKRGETVELTGRARDMNVILLAAPTSDGLKPLVQSSKLLGALGGTRESPAVAAPRITPVGSVADLGDGVTVELLGVCEHPGEGKPWWRPDGSPLEKAPYKTTGTTLPAQPGFRAYEFAARVAAPDDAHVKWAVPGGTYSTDTGSPMGANGERLRDLRAYKANQPEDKQTAEVHIAVAAGPWQGMAVHTAPDKEGAYNSDDGRAVAFGVAYEKDGRTHVPVTLNFNREQMDYQVVATDENGTSHVADVSGGGGNMLMSTTCSFDLPPARIKELRLQTRQWMWANFQPVALRPRATAGTGIVLPEADRKPVLLDLASGELVPLPGKGPDPNDIQQALRKQGRGDILYDCDLGDRTLILMRDARSEQARGDTGDPGVQGYLIGKQLPETLTVATAEGRRYDVTILAADDTSCTMTYVPAGSAPAQRPPESTPTAADTLAAGVAPVKLANGVTVRFVAYSQLTADGLKWWSAANEPAKVPNVYEADVDGLGTVLAFEISPPNGEVYAETYQGSQKDPIQKSWRLPDSNIRLFALGEQRNFANVEVTTEITEPPVVASIPLTGADRGKIVEVGKFGIDEIVDLQVVSGTDKREDAADGAPPAIQFSAIRTRDSYPSVVAVEDREGLSFPLDKKSDDARTATYQTAVWPDQLSAVLIEASPLRTAGVRFRNLSLTPGHATAVQVEADPRQRVNWQYSRVSLAVAVLMDALERYQKEHDLRLPASLEGIRGYLPEDNWPAAYLVYIGKGGVPPQETLAVPVAYAGTLLPQGKGTYVVYAGRGVRYTQFEGPKRLAALGILSPDVRRSADTVKPPDEQGDPLKRLLEEAQAGGTVTIPKGRYTSPVEVTKAVTLRGETAEECIIEVTADRPAILINAGGEGDVTLENVTIRWQLATDQRIEQAAVVWVKGTNAVIRNCRFEPLGDGKRSPMAVYIEGPSKSTVEKCRFNGFDYVVSYGQGAEGVVQDCVIADCGHQGIINYDGSTLTVQRNVITGSKYHAIRCSGGVLRVRDNILFGNANRAIYLGNRTGQGAISNNVIVGNGTGISAFGRANYVITNNVIMGNEYAGIDMRDSCRLSISKNILAKNPRGVALHKEGTENFNVLGRNAWWSNATDAENMETPEGCVTADPQFVDPNNFDFTARGPAAEQGFGLANTSIIREVYDAYARTLRTPQTGAVSGKKSASVTDTPPEQLRRVLLTGDSQARRAAFGALLRGNAMATLDDSFLPAMWAASTDPDRSVRVDAARMAGGRWVWRGQTQDPNAIELMLKLSLDSEREVRYNAVYYGLSTARNAGEPVVRRLIEMAMTDHERNLYGRIVWGLRGPVQAPPEMVTKILAEGLDRAGSDGRYAASIYALYRDVLEKEPPAEWGLAKVKERYPDDAFALLVVPMASFAPKDEDALWAEFSQSLPQGITAERLPKWFSRRDEIVCTARLRGRDQVDAVKKAMESHPRLQWRDALPLTMADQLFFEEAAGLPGR